MRRDALQTRMEEMEREKEKQIKSEMEQIKLKMEQLDKKLQLVESEPPGGEFPVLVLDKNALVEVYGPTLSTRPQFLDVKGNGCVRVVFAACVVCMLLLPPNIRTICA